MSWNISRFKLKKLKGLSLPLSSLFLYEREDWHPQRYNNDDGSVEFMLSEGGGISGTIDENDILHVTNIECDGETSGGSWEYVMDEAFKHSKGEFEAVIVWESGEYIERYTVSDGVITRKDIEL